MTPIAAPVRIIASRVERRQMIDEAWPGAPDWLRAGLARMLTNPRATSDAMLIVADGLESARQEASRDGRLVIAHGLDRLAGVFREMAPERADIPLLPEGPGR